MGQLRKIARELSKRARNGDRGAAQELLRHSIDLGHRRLALHRFFLATAMGVEPPPEHLRYCAELLGSIPEDAVRDICAAFKSGEFPDSLDNARYFNIQLMKEISLR